MKWSFENLVLVGILGVMVYELTSKTSTVIPVTVIPPNEPTSIGPPPALRGDTTVNGLGFVPYGVTASDIASPFAAPYVRSVSSPFQRSGSAFFATGGRFMYPVRRGFP